MKTKIKNLSAAFKRKWIKALRSGKYKQGSGSLYNKNTKTYCCLGVACVIQGINIRYLNIGFPQHEFDSIPDIIREDKNQNETDVACKLARLNDSGKSFSEIADYIKTNL